MENGKLKIIFVSVFLKSTDTELLLKKKRKKEAMKGNLKMNVIQKNKNS